MRDGFVWALMMQLSIDDTVGRGGAIGGRLTVTAVNGQWSCNHDI